MSRIVNDVRPITESIEVGRPAVAASKSSYVTSARLGEEIKRVEGNIKAEADRKRREEVERLRTIARFD